jgi:signal transduction histidine kinase
LSTVEPSGGKVTAHVGAPVWQHDSGRSKKAESRAADFSVAVRIGMICSVSALATTVIVILLVYAIYGQHSEFPIEPSSEGQLYVAILVSGFLAIIVSLLIGILYSIRLTRPLNRMYRVGQEFRSGDSSVRTKIDGTDEISRLGAEIDAIIEAYENGKRMEYQLTNDVAHELRTPLMAMQATIEAMMDGVLPSDATRLSVLNTEVIRLGHLVDAQLKLARLEDGKTELKIEVVSISQLVHELLQSHEILVEYAELTMDSRIQPDVFARADSGYLRQAIANLLSNAIRYTDSGGHIIVEVRSQHGLAQIFVTDTGEGIAGEDMPHLFSRFWRAATSRDRESGGLGVGLAMVKHIVKRHHGFVDVQSELGVGSTFTISIPLYKQPRMGRRR